MLRLLTTADTEILAAAHAVRELPDGFPAVRCANPAAVADAGRVPRRVAARRARRRRAAARRAARVARRASTSCARAASATGSRSSCSAARPSRTPSWPSCRSRRPAPWRRRSTTCATAASTTRASCCASSPTRSLLEGHGFEDPPRAAGARRLPARRGDGELPARRAGRPRVGARLLPLAPGDRQHRVRRRAGRGDRGGGRRRACACGPTRCGPARTGASRRSSCSAGEVDALVTTVLAVGRLRTPATEWHAEALEALGVPVIQALCATTSRARAGRRPTRG